MAELEDPNQVIQYLRNASKLLSYGHHSAGEREAGRTNLIGSVRDIIFGFGSSVDALADLLEERGSTSSGVEHNNQADEWGRPAGGFTEGRGFHIDWQNGPLAVDGVRQEPNGAFVEDVIEAAIGRIEFYQNSPFHCVENAVALGHLKAAAEVLAERTRCRERRGVEGTHQV